MITSTPELLIAPKPSATKYFFEEETQRRKESLFATGQAELEMKTATAEAAYWASGFHEPKNIYSPTPNISRSCRIKGNVSWRNNDEKIYHCPNWRDYDRTSIDVEDGDRWFCTEQEAIAAGFRKPLNVTAPCVY